MGFQREPTFPFLGDRARGPSVSMPRAGSAAFPGRADRQVWRSRHRATRRAMDPVGAEEMPSLAIPVGISCAIALLAVAMCV